MKETLRPLDWVRGVLALPSEFGINERMVLVCLAMHADNRDAVAWPSVDTIACECGLCRREVFRCRKSLRERGLIECLGKSYGGSSRLRLKPDLLALLIEKQGSFFTQWCPTVTPIVPHSHPNSAPQSPNLLTDLQHLTAHSRAGAGGFVNFQKEEKKEDFRGDGLSKTTLDLEGIKRAQLRALAEDCQRRGEQAPPLALQALTGTGDAQ